MNTPTPTTLADRIRNWAAGTLPTEASAYILTTACNGRLLELIAPAINDNPQAERASIRWDTVIQLTAPLSTGEQRLLRLAASLSGRHPIDAYETLYPFDPANSLIVVKAIAHAVGHRTLDQ